jgi:hypothetical protein
VFLLAIQHKNAPDLPIYAEVIPKWMFRTEKSAKNYPRIIDKLNYKGLLTDQNPQKKYIVYNIRWADAIAHVNNRLKIDAFQINSHKLSPKQFVADTTDCFYKLTVEWRPITCAPYLIPVP